MHARHRLGLKIAAGSTKTPATANGPFQSASTHDNLWR